MAREVLLRKLHYLRQLLADLTPYQDATSAQVRQEHYKIERILELLVMAASDLIFHLLAEENIQPESYRHAFQLASEQDWLPQDLAIRLQDATGLRNILAHLYETIDYDILQAAIPLALADFAQFIAIFETYLNQDQTNS